MNMNNRKENKKYWFTVEGETEKWYLDWLQDKINEEESLYQVSIKSIVLQNPKKFAKNVNSISTLIRFIR